MDNLTYLITGGAGSFGQEMTRTLLANGAGIIRIFDANEFFITEMREAFPDKRLRFQIGDIRDRERLRFAMRGANVVIHAAALKHIDICEYSPEEAIATNVIGSVNVGRAAVDTEVDKVLFISSDKAVHPLSIYGATKLVAEKFFIQANAYSDKTKFSCIRYGNFWGSRGSVIPKWLKQGSTGVITITEKDMTRFWITLEEASSFALTCLKRMQGGEIFIPIMPTYTLEEIASKVAPECKFKYIGRRKGEKLNEMLLAEGEERYLTKENDCLIIRE